MPRNTGSGQDWLQPGTWPLPGSTNGLRQAEGDGPQGLRAWAHGSRSEQIIVRADPAAVVDHAHRCRAAGGRRRAGGTRCRHRDYRRCRSAGLRPREPRLAEPGLGSARRTALVGGSATRDLHNVLSQSLMARECDTWWCPSAPHLVDLGAHAVRSGRRRCLRGNARRRATERGQTRFQACASAGLSSAKR
jgi:hypothetical protein